MVTEADWRPRLLDALTRGDRDELEDLLWRLVERRELYAALRELEPRELARLAEVVGDEGFGE
ncbi:MAG: magnesium transporter, partial [Thermomicrobium sp.]|nr:magnesium transporter [Thermomicrobium sp.]